MFPCLSMYLNVSGSVNLNGNRDVLFRDMATKNDQEEWAERLAASVGRQVKRYRARPELRLSAQALSDRTAQLGHEVKRSVIANLESGRRGTVTLADVFVLAQALMVPPIQIGRASCRERVF